MKALSTTCDTNHTCGPLKALSIDAVRMRLYPDEYLHAAPQREQYAVQLHCLIRTQTKIGWCQLFNGRFCNQWGDIQGEHLYQIRQQLPNKHNTGQSWQVAVISLLWDQWYDVWVLRNKAVHGKDAATRVMAEKGKLHGVWP